jgi:hypothetical protein
MSPKFGSSASASKRFTIAFRAALWALTTSIHSLNLAWPAPVTPYTDRSCRRTFFPRCEKAVAFELVEGSVDAGAVDWSEPVAKRCINEPIAMAWLFCEQQQHGRIDEVTGRCYDEAATQVTFHTYNLPTISDGET